MKRETKGEKPYHVTFNLPEETYREDNLFKRHGQGVLSLPEALTLPTPFS
jgi:hypothetical protein